VQTLAVESLEDPRVAEYCNLRDADLRRQRGVFMAESRFVVRLLLEASRFRASSLLLNPRAFEALRDVCEGLPDEIPVYVAEKEIFSRIAGLKMHQGCLAVGEIGPLPAVGELLDGLPKGRSSVIVLETLSNTENVGNVFRNAMAFGADAVFLSPQCCDPLYRKSIRVSMGGTLRVPFAQCEAWPDALDELRAAGYRVIALDPGENAIELSELDTCEPQGDRVAWLLGSEGDGLSEAALERADLRVRIGMVAGVDSLNVAAASGIAMHHFLVQGGRSLAAQDVACGKTAS
jgi:tRNA G18 (ribose-2'-O)-methylase SpoU